MSTNTDLGDCQGASGDAHIGTGDEVSGLYYPCDESTSVGIKQGWVRWVANAMQLIGYYLLLNDGFTIGLFFIRNQCCWFIFLMVLIIHCN